jgi:hypothetical protein
MHYKQAIFGIPPSFLYPAFLAPSLAFLGLSYYFSNYPRPIGPSEPDIDVEEPVLFSDRLKSLYQIARQRRKKKEKEFESDSLSTKKAFSGALRLATLPASFLYAPLGTVGALLIIPYVRAHLHAGLGTLNKAFLKTQRAEQETARHQLLLKRTLVQDFLRQGMPEVAWEVLSPEEKESVMKRLKAYGFDQEEIDLVLPEWEKQLREMERVSKEYEEKILKEQEKTKAPLGIALPPQLVRESKRPRKKAASSALSTILSAPFILSYLMAKQLLKVQEPLTFYIDQPKQVALKRIRELEDIRELESQMVDVADIEVHRLGRNVSELFDVVEAIKNMREELERKKAVEKNKETTKKIEHEIKQLKAQERQAKKLLEDYFERSPEELEGGLGEVIKEMPTKSRKGKPTTSKKQERVTTSDLAKLFIR